MKRIFNLLLLCIIVMTCNAQQNSTVEHYGKTLNLGVGISYYGYIHNPLPVALINYELDIVHHVTLAPFVGLYSYRNTEFGLDNTTNQFAYRETVAPIGIKAAYYLDALLRAHHKWDFYIATSFGFIIRKITWNSNYNRARDAYKQPKSIYVDAHAGAEYHVTKKAGLTLDISTGVSTFGLAIHLNK